MGLVLVLAIKKFFLSKNFRNNVVKFNSFFVVCVLALYFVVTNYWYDNSYELIAIMDETLKLPNIYDFVMLVVNWNNGMPNTYRNTMMDKMPKILNDKDEIVEQSNFRIHQISTVLMIYYTVKFHPSALTTTKQQLCVCCYVSYLSTMLSSDKRRSDILSAS